MVNSYIFYTILSLIILLLAVMAGKTKSALFAVLIVATLTFVGGFRAYTVGRDTAAYVEIFANISNGGKHNKDIGFTIVSRILLTICDNPTFVFLVYALITHGLITARLWELTKGEAFTYAVFAYYSFYFFETMNIMRQFVVVAVIFYATRYLAKRKYFTYLLILLPCITFHISAVLGVVFLLSEFFYWKKLTKKQKQFLIAVVVLGVATVALAFGFIMTKLDIYLHYFKHIQLDIGLRVFALLLILIVTSWLYKPKLRDSKRLLNRQGDKYILSTTRLYYFWACCFGFAGYLYEFMDRLGFYFTPFVFVYFGMAVKERRSLERVIIKMIIILSIAYILYNYIFVLNGSYHHPYKFIWE